ncbi:MAG TPA: phage holin family protein [Jiangellaceae bacterium]|nr:phage holin family protein [Jiangellaceae bacterium]
MATQPTTDGNEASIGELVAAIKDDVRGLVQGEIDLAKAELRDEARHAGLGGGLIGVAVLLGLLAALLLSEALVYGVAALGLSRGWAYLVVGVFYLAMVGALGMIAKSRFALVKGPQRTKTNAQRAAQALRPTPRT